MTYRYLLPFLFTTGLHVAAQTVFIPDLFVRDALNDAKPNSVDANGYCDTALWNAQPPDQVNMIFTSLPNGTIVDLEGIQHLKASELYLWNGQSNNVVLDWSGYPVGIQSLDMRFMNADLFTGAFLPFPATVDEFICQDCGLGMLPAFNGTWMYFFQEDLSGQVLTVPPTVTYLVMDQCNLTQLPVMPNVTSLDVDDNPLLGVLTNLPAGLLSLQASNTGLTSVPPLPPGLQALGVYNNAITALPALPASLQSLAVQRNQLTTLPPLPAGLLYLNVSYNPMPVLPPFSVPFHDLYADSCGITFLALPGTLQELSLRYCPIDSLPPLPGGVSYLNVRDCAQLTCLPVLPHYMDELQVAGSGITCLPNIPPDLNLNNLGIAPVVCNIGTSPCPLGEELITGTTFLDSNFDGVFDPWETARPNSLVLAQPGDLLTASDINGNYVLPADSGSFTVTGVGGLYEPVTTAPYAVQFTFPGEVDSLNHIGFGWVPGMYDLVTSVAGTNVRPGFNTGLWVHVNNVGTVATAATAQLTFDPALTYVSSNIAPVAVNGNVVDWTVPILGPGDTWSVHVDLYGPPTLVLGDPVVQQATATPSQPDETPADNTYVLNDVVVGSFDPNDKRVEPEHLLLADVASGTRVHYTVRFQNTGTFPADRVLITDTLSSHLQWATMQLEGASHAHSWYIHNGVLHVLFENINLPDSLSNEPGSHGYVKFSFVPSSSLIIGDAVDNIANIYFDYNEPVITNTATFFVETSLAVADAVGNGLRAWPNPAEDVLLIACDAPKDGRLQVIDMTGRTVLEQRVTGTRTTLMLHGLAPGPYGVRCTTAGGAQVLHFVKR